MARLQLKNNHILTIVTVIILVIVFSASAIQTKTPFSASLKEAEKVIFNKGSKIDSDQESIRKEVLVNSSNKEKEIATAENKKVETAETTTSTTSEDKSLSSAEQEFLSNNPDSTNNSFDQSENAQKETGYLKNFLEALGINAGTGRSEKKETELPQAELNKYYCTTLLGINTPGDPFVAFVITQGFAPKGLFLNSSSGSLCGTPIEKGIFHFTVQMDNSSFSGEKTSYRLVVVEAAVKKEEGELKISATQLLVGKIGSEYSFQLQATGGKQAYTWSASGLPDGLELDPSGIIGGSPAKTGEYPVLVTVQDSSGKAVSVTLALIVRTTPIFITSNTLGEGVVNEPFQARLSAQGGVPPYSWELLGPELPEGITFSSINGVIEGTPKKTFAGTIRVKVLDSEKKNDSADLKLEIREHSLKIVDEALTDSFVGTAYSHTLSAEGGIAPYSWTELSGGLPSGVILNGTTGAIIGTPEVKGEFDLTILVSDSSNMLSKKSFLLRVVDTGLEATPTPTPDKENTDSKDDSGNGNLDTPTPTPTPPAITNFIAIGSDKKVGLVWQNPSDPLFEQTIIVRTNGESIEQADQGTLIYSGTNNNTLDLGLENDQSYKYFAFAQFLSGDANQTLPAEVPATPHQITLSSKPDPFIDEVLNFSPLDPKCFNCASLPKVVLGPPKGKGEHEGSPDVVSIGAKVNNDNGNSAPYGGSITLEFNDNIVYNGAGADFTIFENAFRLGVSDDYFVEPATVEVSVDGIHFYRFPFDFVPHYKNETLNLFNPLCYSKGFAGVNPVYSNNNNPSPLNTVLSGGDSFDLNDLPGTPLSWIRFIRITSTGDNWLTDQQGEAVRHSNERSTLGASGKGNSGFDLDAVTAINF